MELASAALSPLVKKLGELAMSELTLEKRVRKDIASLERELKAMHLALQRVQVPPEQLDEGTVEWASNLRELSYDMEDAIDAFILHAGKDDDPAASGLRSRMRGLLNKTARLFSKGKVLHQVADAVSEAKRLATELAEINQRYAGLKLKDTSAAPDIDPRLKAMFTEAANLVGVDGPKDELIKELSDASKKDVQTVSIVGFGGLGKTTLAKAVYDTIKVDFECSAFVSVSKNPDITRVFKKILFELDKNRYENINELVRDVDQLIVELKGYLRDKRYLVVIDDLWDETNWEFIKCAFSKNTCGSRLITTTRNHNVAEASCSSNTDKIHKMKPLSDEDSIKLFHSRIFHRGATCPPELEQVSRDILKKCGGVPLAIITIASLLASGKQVKTKDQWLILLNSIGHGLKGCWRVEDMYKILSLSYYDLPSHLKPCLLYLSLFPEDYDIYRDRLIWRWIAEGFIRQDNSGYDNLFDIGESYFIELINRSMIQPIFIDEEGKAVYCRVHDMVLDLIRSLSSKENFVIVWDKDEETKHAHNLEVCRRLSIQNNTSTRWATMASMSKLRSFTIFSPAMDSMPSLTQFKVIHVLDLNECDLSKCDSYLKLRHLGSLAHLRYLGLRQTGIRELPGEVGKLQFLQTLDISSNQLKQELPRTIIGLRNLMRLQLDHETRLPKGFGNLTSLEVLSIVRIGGDDSAVVVKELGQLSKLRDLSLWWEEVDVGESWVQSLGNLQKLQRLLVWAFGWRGDLISAWEPPSCLRKFLCFGQTGVLPRLPLWIKNNSSSLTFLRVSVSKLGPEDLQVLGALPSLHTVVLSVKRPITDGGHPLSQMTVNAGAFPCVRSCWFLNFVMVPSMFSQGAMPLMQELEFSVRAWDFASGGGGFGPEDLRMGHLPSLEKVDVDLWYRTADDAALVEGVVAALRQAADDHPNRIALSIIRMSNSPSRSQAYKARSTPTTPVLISTSERAETPWHHNNHKASEASS